MECISQTISWYIFCHLPFIRVILFLKNYISYSHLQFSGLILFQLLTGSMYQAFNYYQNGIKTHVNRTKSKIDNQVEEKSNIIIKKSLY